MRSVTKNPVIVNAAQIIYSKLQTLADDTTKKRMNDLENITQKKPLLLKIKEVTDNVKR